MRSPAIKKLGKVAQHIERQACKGATPGERKSRRRLIILAARDGKRCHWCQDPVSFPWEPGMNTNMPKVASFDHKKTKCSGGSNHTKNGLLACRECNSVRGNTSYDKFAKKVAEEGIETLVAAWKEKAAARKAKGIMSRRQRKQYLKDTREERMANLKIVRDREQARKALAAQQEAARAARRSWLNWALRELSEWGQVSHQLGVVF